MNKQASRIRPVNTENKPTVAGLGAKWVKPITRYRLPIMEWISHENKRYNTL